MRRTLAAAAAALVLAGCTAGHPTRVVRHGSGYRLTVGVDLYVDSDYTLPQVRSWGTRDIAYLADVLKVKSVSIDWDYVIPSPTSDRVEASGFVTPPPADIAALTSIAKSYGMNVTYRVLFWLAGRTAPLAPAHPDAFFASLLAAEAPYLALARQQGVPEFITGTERTSLEASTRWPWFFTQAARLYPGTLSYAMWGGEPYDGGFFWGRGCAMPIAVCGITAYPNTDLPATASAQQLTAAWEQVLSRVPRTVLERTEIDEIGIPAEDGAYRHPWDWPGTGHPDDQVQGRWFTAACTAAAREHMRGIFFWNLNLADDPAHPYPSPVKFEDRSASEAAIRDCSAEAAGVS